MNFIRIKTLTKKETHRFLKVWPQTILSPVMIAFLYIIVFGGALSSQISEINGISYLSFIIPGLVLLQSTTNAFQNASSSLIISKYHGTISDLIHPPLTALEKTIGFCLGGIFRGLLVSLAIFIFASFFMENFMPKHPIYLLLILLISNGIFATMGTIAGIFGKSFDHISGFTTFIITPMGFLGGIFYSLEMLPPFAQTISLFNPFLYFVDSARWAYFGVSEINPFTNMSFIFGLFFCLFIFNWWVFHKGYRIQN